MNERIIPLSFTAPESALEGLCQDEHAIMQSEIDVLRYLYDAPDDVPFDCQTLAFDPDTHAYITAERGATRIIDRAIGTTAIYEVNLDGLVRHTILDNQDGKVLEESTPDNREKLGVLRHMRGIIFDSLDYQAAGSLCESE